MQSPVVVLASTFCSSRDRVGNLLPQGFVFSQRKVPRKMNEQTNQPSSPARIDKLTAQQEREFAILRTLDDARHQVEQALRLTQRANLLFIKEPDRPPTEVTLTFDVEKIGDLASDVMDLKNVIVFYPWLFAHVLELLFKSGDKVLRNHALDLLEYAVKVGAR